MRGTSADEAPPLEFWGGASEYAMVGTTFRPQAIRAALPSALEPAESMSGGIVAFQCDQNSRLPAFGISYAWIDVKGHDTLEGAPGRFIVGGFGAGPIVGHLRQRWASISIVEAGSRIRSRGDVLTVAAQSQGGSNLRVAIGPTGRSMGPSSYHVHNVGLSKNGSITAMPVRAFNEFEEAEPLVVELDFEPTGGEAGLVPTSYLWAARPKNGLFVIGDTFVGSPVWEERARERIAAARLRSLVMSIDRGAILLNADGGVVDVNQPARRILGHGISLVRERLIVSVGQQGALERLIANALLPASQRDAYDPIAVERTFGRTPLLVQAISIADSDANTLDISPGSAAWALVLITDLDVPVIGSTKALELLGLTAAEARIAVAVGSGLSPRQAGQRLSVSENTARSALTLIYSKLMIKRQSELALVVARTSASNRSTVSAPSI
ncbi:MAG: helix-turn-helix transcriptional regulator [Alphaproteobacteria bacterium]